MPSRRHVHTRSIRVDAYARDDGLWDLEAVLADLPGQSPDLIVNLGDHVSGPLEAAKVKPTPGGRPVSLSLIVTVTGVVVPSA